MQMKLLYFDAGGYCLWAKRLERGRFALARERVGGAVALSRTEFEALIEGLDLVVKKRRKRWSPRAQGALGSGRIKV